MNDRGRDPLEAALKAYREQPVPPAREGLEDELVAAFDRAFPPRVALVRRGAAVLAAAAVVLVALRLGVAPPVPSPIAVVVAQESDEHGLLLARLDARLDALLATFDAGALRAPSPRDATRDAPRASAADLFEARAQDDPALYRLASARAYEEDDPAAAARRYRELLALDASGPAAEVARRRLAVLNR